MLFAIVQKERRAANLTVLLIITTLGIVLLGFLVMRRLDSFINSGGVLDSSQGRANQGVLVYGAPDVAKKIHNAGLRYKTLSTPIFPEDGFYSALFALSGDDLTNLTICRAAKNSDPGITIIARCSSPELRSVYEAVGCNRLLDTNETVDELLAELRGTGR